LSLENHFEAHFFIAPNITKFDPVVLACYVVVVVLHLICGLSINDCTFLLPSIQHIVKMTLEHAGSSSTKLLTAFPKDPRTVLKTLELSPEVHGYVCCPRCFALYPQDSEVPVSCSYKETTSSKVCAEPLMRLRRIGDKTKQVYVREYDHQVFKSWLGRFLCRPGIENVLDRDVFWGTPEDAKNDIFAGDLLRKFSSANGSRFLPSVGSEGRYVFGLSVDAFNPFLNKQAGKKASSTAIYMVCFNLPPSTRYKVENMYLAGVIPGPREPSLTQINHLLRPLVDELVQFWNSGVWYTRTPLYHSGRLVKVALVPLICDLKAARQVMGHGSHSATKFCSICTQPWDERDSLDETLRIPMTGKEYRLRAFRWKRAQSQAEREKLFKKYGVRWSVLLDLPYWDPPRFTIIDSMHTVLLGHLHRHCSIIWGMNPIRSDASNDHARSQGSSVNYQAQMSAAWTIRSGSEHAVRSLKKSLLRGFCALNNIIASPLIEEYDTTRLQKMVLEYVSTTFNRPSFLTHPKRVSQGWFTSENQTTPTRPPDYLFKVASVPEFMIGRIETQLYASRDSDELLETTSKTRKVLLIAVYVRLLRRAGTPAGVINELVLSSSSKKVTRSDIVKLILERVSGRTKTRSLVVTFL